jgi:hypothetical protein
MNRKLDLIYPAHLFSLGIVGKDIVLFHVEQLKSSWTGQVCGEIMQ